MAELGFLDHMPHNSQANAYRLLRPKVFDRMEDVCQAWRIDWIGPCWDLCSSANGTRCAATSAHNIRTNNCLCNDYVFVIWPLVTGMSIQILVEGHRDYYAWAIPGLLYAAITAILYFRRVLFDEAVEQDE